MLICNPLIIFMVPRTRLELVRDYVPRDFKSLASTNSATQAIIKGFFNNMMDLCQAILFSIRPKTVVF
jgi:hypothetical protein